MPSKNLPLALPWTFVRDNFICSAVSSSLRDQRNPNILIFGCFFLPRESQKEIYGVLIFWGKKGVFFWWLPPPWPGTDSASIRCEAEKLINHGAVFTAAWCSQMLKQIINGIHERQESCARWKFPPQFDIFAFDKSRYLATIWFLSSIKFQLYLQGSTCQLPGHELRLEPMVGTGWEQVQGTGYRYRVRTIPNQACSYN